MKKKLYIVKCISLVSSILLYKLLEYILKLNNLAFMSIIVYIFTSIFIILALSILIRITIDLYNFSKKKPIKLQIRIISGIGSIIVAVSTTILLIYGFVAFVFSYQPEYIIEKDGKPMVAYVNSFLEVNVNYYDYVNRFVRGNRLKISDNYGKGGYDPFKSDEPPTVERSIYYDDNGRVIK